MLENVPSTFLLLLSLLFCLSLSLTIQSNISWDAPSLPAPSRAVNPLFLLTSLLSWTLLSLYFSNCFIFIMFHFICVNYRLSFFAIFFYFLFLITFFLPFAFEFHFLLSFLFFPTSVIRFTTFGLKITRKNLNTNQKRFQIVRVIILIFARFRKGSNFG